MFLCIFCVSCTICIYVVYLRCLYLILSLISNFIISNRSNVWFTRELLLGLLILCLCINSAVLNLIDLVSIQRLWFLSQCPELSVSLSSILMVVPPNTSDLIIDNTKTSITKVFDFQSVSMYMCNSFKTCSM